jgi:hypothetical protein
LSSTVERLIGQCVLAGDRLLTTQGTISTMCITGNKGSAHPTVYTDNNSARVTEWRFAGAGDNTGWHRHEYDYVVVPLFTGLLIIEDAQGNRTAVQLTHGVPYFRQAGVEHDVINGNEFECAFVEIEIVR